MHVPVLCFWSSSSASACDSDEPKHIMKELIRFHNYSTLISMLSRGRVCLFVEGRGSRVPCRGGGYHVEGRG